MNQSTNISDFSRRWISLGALLMLLAVMLGAFGAHLLQARLEPRALETFRTGVLYQQLHALGLILLGLAGQWAGESRWLRLSARTMLMGIVLFCGALYLLAGGAPRWLGMVAPLGGLSSMAAWWMLAMHVRRSVRKHD